MAIKKGWFGPKRFGFGIGPRSWEGWATVLVFVLAAYGLRALHLSPDMRMAVTALLAVGLLVVMAMTYRRM